MHTLKEMETENTLFPFLFEEDYITRSLGSIVNQPDELLNPKVVVARQKC